MNQTIFKHWVGVLIICISIIFFAGCKENNDEPELKLPENAITKERFDNEIVNRLWKNVGVEYMDDEGNVLHPMYYYIYGEAPCECFYIHEEGYISFSIASFTSSNTKAGFIFEDGKAICYGGTELTSLDNDTLCLRLPSSWIEDPKIDPNAHWRHDVWRSYKLVEDKNPDWESLLSGYIPCGYNPEDYGLR